MVYDRIQMGPPMSLSEKELNKAASMIIKEVKLCLDCEQTNKQVILWSLGTTFLGGSEPAVCD